MLLRQNSCCLSDEAAMTARRQLRRQLHLGAFMRPTTIHTAAWRYPGELEEFKLYAPVIEEQPFDRFYKKPVSTESKKEEVTDKIFK